jgi:hypothetical protein
MSFTSKDRSTRSTTVSSRCGVSVERVLVDYGEVRQRSSYAVARSERSGAVAGVGRAVHESECGGGELCEVAHD